MRNNTQHNLRNRLQERRLRKSAEKFFKLTFWLGLTTLISLIVFSIYYLYRALLLLIEIL